MEKIIAIKNEYDSLGKLYDALKKEVTFECSIDYDKWEMRTDANGHMEKCIIIKKSGMHGIKLFFTGATTIKVTYVIPSALMNAYFGKSQKRYRNIIEIITGKIKDVILAGSQQKAFDELLASVQKTAA